MRVRAAATRAAADEQDAAADRVAGAGRVEARPPAEAARRVRGGERDRVVGPVLGADPVVGWTLGAEQRCPPWGLPAGLLRPHRRLVGESSAKPLSE